MMGRHSPAIQRLPSGMYCFRGWSPALLPQQGQALGKRGEEAVAYLAHACGWEVVGRNLRYLVGELDLWVQQGSRGGYIEVKTRWKSPEQMTDLFTSQKKRRCQAAATRYARQKSCPWTESLAAFCQVDIVQGAYNYEISLYDWNTGEVFQL